MSGAVVIDMREWAIARARNAKVRWLIRGLTKFQSGMGPTDAVALSMVARSLTEDGWARLDEIAAALAKRAGQPFGTPSSDLTRRLTLDQLEDDARAVRLAAIDSEAQ